MMQQLFSLFFNKKALIRVAFAVLSLGGAAHAQSANKTDAAAVGNPHAKSTLQGNNYNFMEGGGG